MTASFRKPPSRCACGKIKSRWMTDCRDCMKVRRDTVLTAARAIVATGRCPTCGHPLRRNSSLAGWWQCSQLGAETHRADPSQPSCNFQTFTE